MVKIHRLSCNKRTFDRFYAPGTVEDREHPGRLSKITEQKINKGRDVMQDEPQSSVRTVAITCSILPTAAYRIMDEYLGLKPFKMQFVQQLYEEDLKHRVNMCITLIPMLQNKTTQENIFF